MSQKNLEQNSTKITSPCRMICAVSGQSGFCIGCGRTLHEISQWRQLDDKTRAEIIQTLPARLAMTQTN